MRKLQYDACTLILGSAVALAGCGTRPAGETEATGTETGETSEGAQTTAGPSETETGETTTDGSGSESETGGDPCAEVMCGPSEACIAGDCVDVDRPAIEMGCHPLGVGQCMYPWPANVFTREDASSATGLRLDYNPELLPKNLQDQTFAAEELTNHLEGFSPNSQIRLTWPGGFDTSAAVPGWDDIGASLAADAPIVLLDVDTGERIPFFAELDALAMQEGAGPDREALFIRPMKRLDFAHHYAVAIRGLKGKDGQPLVAAPLFEALRDGLATDLPQLEALRPGYEDIFTALDSAGIARDDLQLAWDFTTIPQEPLQRDARQVMPAIVPMVESGDLGFTVDSVEEDLEGPVRYVLRGTFEVPNCMTGDAGPGELLNRPNGVDVECSGTVSAPFVIAVPKVVVDAGVPARVSVYGHGLLGTAEETRHVAARAGGVILAGTDFWGMANEDISNVFDVITSNFENGYSLPERLLQSSVNFSTLGYLMAGSDIQTVPELAGLVAEGEEVFYLGGSQGGIMGGTIVGMAPNLHRGVLVVGGANYSLMVWRSTAFNEVNSAWKTFHPDAVEREFIFSLYQSVFDFSDPLTFAEQVWGEDPIVPGPQKGVLLVESIGDSQVPNLATEMMARSYGMQMVDPPIYPVYDVPGTTDPIENLALLQVDTGNGLAPPVNLPPDGDNGAHGSAVDGVEVQTAVVEFLLDGQVQNHCDGPCDPG